MATKIEVITMFTREVADKRHDLAKDFRLIVEAAQAGKQMLTGSMMVWGMHTVYALTYEGDKPTEDEIIAALTE